MGQEDAVFTVILGGGGGPVIGTRHYTPIIKDSEFIMFNLVPAVGADGYAGDDLFINHGRFMSGHSSVGDDADMGAPLVGGNKKQCYRSGINVVKKGFKSVFITEREDSWCFWCVFGKILHIGKKTVDSMIFL